MVFVDLRWLRSTDVEKLIDEDQLARVENEVADVERALSRLDQGTYENCEVCGTNIGEERLGKSPITRTCSQHS